jgi:hypothetical protein
VIERELDWFPARDERPPRITPEQPPVSRLAAFRRFADGRLGVLIHVRAADWQSAIRPSDGPFGGWIADPVDDVWDTVIEILDDAGRSLGSGRVDQLLIGFADDVHVYAYSESASGEPRIDVFRFRQH